MNASTGTFVAYICGAFVDYDKLPYVIIVFPVVFFVGTTILPETPSSLLRQNRIEVNAIEHFQYSVGNVNNNFS